MSNKKKISGDDSLNFMNFKKKLDSVIHFCRKTEYKKINEKRRNQKLTKSLDKSLERLSYPNISNNFNSFYIHKSTNFFNDKKVGYNSADFTKKEKKRTLSQKDIGLKDKNIKKKEIFPKVYLSENNRFSMEVNEMMENEIELLEKFEIELDEEGSIQKLKEIIYKLQLRDAIHRQTLIKMQKNNETINKNIEKLQIDNLTLLELNKQENKNSKNLMNLLEIERKKVLSLEKKMKKLDPIETAKLLEKLHEKNENLIMENKKLEEMIKQLLLNREISRIRKLYPSIIENSLLNSNENSTRTHQVSNKTIQEVYEEEQSYYNENRDSNEKSIKTSFVDIINQNDNGFQKTKIKNICLDLKDILKGV